MELDKFLLKWAVWILHLFNFCLQTCMPHPVSIDNECSCKYTGYQGQVSKYGGSVFSKTRLAILDPGRGHSFTNPQEIGTTIMISIILYQPGRVTSLRYTRSSLGTDCWLSTRNVWLGHYGWTLTKNSVAICTCRSCHGIWVPTFSQVRDSGSLNSHSIQVHEGRSELKDKPSSLAFNLVCPPDRGASNPWYPNSWISSSNFLCDRSKVIEFGIRKFDITYEHKSMITQCSPDANTKGC